MNEDLQNEIEAINSIYGEQTLLATETEEVFVLRLPQHDASLRVHFSKDYPFTPPTFLGSQSSGEHTRKGDAAHIVDLCRRTLGEIYQPGEVCLFDVIEEVNKSSPETIDPVDYNPEDERPSPENPSSLQEDSSTYGEPSWILSDITIELKSVFVARCAPVSSPDQAKSYVQHLLDSDKKVRSATHNITAWRIKGPNGTTYQDCDDDGETAAGGRVLHLMQLMDLWNVMVVVTRWYGGHQLGPKRFSIINAVARDAFVKGSFVDEDASSRKKARK